MSKKPQAREWWFADDGSQVYIVGVKLDGNVIFEDERGYHGNGFNTWDNWHHEPYCTGWDWKPETFPQWYLHSNNKTVLKRTLPDRVFYFERGSEIGAHWSEWHTEQNFKQLTEAEALALLDKPEPIESPEDWVEITHTHPDHVPRVGIDWFTTWDDNPVDSSRWVKQEAYHTKKTVAVSLKESQSRHKCRRKDLPPITPQKPAMRTVTLYKWIVWDEEGEESERWQSDTPSDCWDNYYKTGESKTVEVPVDVRPD